jgi:flagellar P-ring protein precursor FlgI
MKAHKTEPRSSTTSGTVGKILPTLLLVATILWPAAAEAQARIKDISSFEGVRDNLLIGYGLVVGLDGTGDDLDSSVFTRESLIGMLQRLGVNARDEDLDTDNVAAVMVTANLPAFARQGSRIDVDVSALGDAESLLGGTLLVTPLLGADGEVFSVAQGPVQIGGFSAQGNAQNVTKGVPTAGRIPNGAIIEREIGFELRQLDAVKLSLRNPDFTTAQRVAEAINAYVGVTAAASLDSGTVQLRVPERYHGNMVAFLTDIEQLPIRTDQPAKVVIDERSGVIVMGEKVRISTVAIAQGNLTIRVTETHRRSVNRTPFPRPVTPSSSTAPKSRWTRTERGGWASSALASACKSWSTA